MHCHISLLLQTTADQMNIFTAKFHSIYKQLQTKWIYAFPHFIIFRDTCRTTDYMHCRIPLYLQTTADQIKICTATFNCIYRQLQTNTIYALPHFILFSDNCSPNEYMHCQISFFLQKTEDQMNICSANFHCIYKQLQTNWVYAQPHFILFTDSFRPNQYKPCHITFYLQTTAEQMNICIATFHSIYRLLQTNTIFELPHFISFTDNCRPNKNMHCHISFYLQPNANKLKICNATYRCINKTTAY